MTDKVLKIREKVVEMVNSINPFIPDEDGKNSDYEAGKLDAATHILQIIDSFEEPVSEEIGDYDHKAVMESLYPELKEEPVSEELEEAAKHNTFKYVFDKNVKETLISELKYIGVNSFKDGAKWQKDRIMKDATDVTVHIDAGGYPYIPQIELYDYDNDVPLAKEGDKYKVVLIKDE